MPSTSKATIQAVNQVIQEYSFRLTVRQIYYRLVSPPYQLWPNTLRSYKNLVSVLTTARERKDVDWRRIEDRRRSTSGGESGANDPSEFLDSWEWRLENLERFYTQNRWSTQDKQVEVWVEKEALAALFEQATQDLGVVVFPTVGYSSLTSFMESVERFGRSDKEIIVLDFRDHDPSGVDMSRDVEDRLKLYARILGRPEVGDRLTVKRCALTIEQVHAFNLAPNPTKKADSRTAAYQTLYGNDCWELDAYPPDELQKLIQEKVKAEIDTEAWDRIEAETAKNRGRIKAARESAKDDIAALIGRLRDDVSEEESD